jgi:hypothetical protein
MAEILSSASYVRNPNALADPVQQRAVLNSISERIELDIEDAEQIWELLETPQTLDTLCRSLGTKTDRPIRSALSALYEDDLIQVSPDT